MYVGTSSIIGTLVLVVLLAPQDSCVVATLVPRPQPPAYSYDGFGAGFNGGGAVGGGSSQGYLGLGPVGGGGQPAIVFPGPNDKTSAFFGLLKLPYILCYFAARGEWPQYPPHLQGAVLDLGRHVFAMNDYGLRNYCSKHYPVNQCHRPCCSYPVLIRPGTAYSFEDMPAYPNRKVSKRPPGKKPSNDDAEVLEDAGEEAPPAEGEEEEAPADEAAEGEGEEEAPSERLQIPRKSAINGLEDRISFVPLRTTKAQKLDDTGRAAGVSGKIQLPGSVASGVPK
ncbi:uncharacterized protein LOC120422349 isoform X2 [Culex pipiens pallens]|uniref:uncharacterized protein LOC120422349 isoform X2 n=1 Tax=Culex pipiens pallens TaxID=42434 RepID=UPI001952BE95|nr:uncharacterized protein LOC120422349 isoform X2 [Culex pipiens pallens]